MRPRYPPMMLWSSLLFSSPRHRRTRAFVRVSYMRESEREREGGRGRGRERGRDTQGYPAAAAVARGLSTVNKGDLSA